MEIYIELFILQNILINFCLLKLIYLTTKPTSSFFKLLLASTLGTIPSIFAVTILYNNTLLNLVKILSAVLMLIIAFKQSKKQMLFNFILLFLYTYAFYGLTLSLSSTTYFTNFGAISTHKISLEFICLIFIIFTYIFELIVKHLKTKISTNNLLCKIKLTFNNKTITTLAYMDTGNFLSHNNKPVLILDLNVFLNLTNSNLINFLTNKTEEIKTTTVNGHNKLKLFTIDKIEIETNKKTTTRTHQTVAINTTNCFKNTNYKALLSPLFL